VGAGAVGAAGEQELAVGLEGDRVGVAAGREGERGPVKEDAAGVAEGGVEVGGAEEQAGLKGLGTCACE
jgi:hypothetical protein